MFTNYEIYTRHSTALFFENIYILRLSTHLNFDSTFKKILENFCIISDWKVIVDRESKMFFELLNYI